jgi:hypothetical protein
MAAQMGKMKLPAWLEDRLTPRDPKDFIPSKGERKVVLNKKIVNDYSYADINLLVQEFEKDGVRCSESEAREWLSRWCMLPLDEMPLHINSEMLHERVIARWRLKVAR